MEVISKLETLKKSISDLKQSGHKVGFVPTMGALHKGHLSLIEASLAQHDKVIVSIFVNPTQFNNPVDLEDYPRTLEKDLALLDQYSIEVVFVPGSHEVYPEKDTRIFDLDPLDKVLEGEFRPGHFNGVAQVVSKLFDMVEPHRAYFGQKDFQQLAIIRKLTKLLGMNIEIIGCPTIREADGLAMSSRNTLLSSIERKAAPLINETLVKATSLGRTKSPSEIKTLVIEEINSYPLLEVEYFEIVNDQNLMTFQSWEDPGRKIGCIAVNLGKVRLIDNRYFL